MTQHGLERIAVVEEGRLGVLARSRGAPPGRGRAAARPEAIEEL